MRQLLFDRSPSAAHAFIAGALSELDARKTLVEVSPGPQVLASDGMGCAGYFDGHPPHFAIAVGKPFEDWLLVFAHEFCHFKQWEEDAATFKKASDDIELLFEWVAGRIELDEETRWRHARVARDLEHDCESRVLANLESFGLLGLIDPKQYAQKANSYFNFYNYVGARRAWYESGREPYTLPEVWRRFPEALVREEGLSPEREALFAQCAAAPNPKSAP